MKLFVYSLIIACLYLVDIPGETAGKGRVDPPVALHFHQIFPGEIVDDDDQ